MNTSKVMNSHVNNHTPLINKHGILAIGLIMILITGIAYIAHEACVGNYIPLAMFLILPYGWIVVGIAK